MTDEMMLPTQTLAVLRALKEGIDQVLAGNKDQPGVEDAVVAFRDSIGAKGGFHTDFGEIAFVPHPDDIRFDDEKLLVLARAEYPHEVLEAYENVIPAYTVPETVEHHAAAVRGTLHTTLKETRLVIRGGEVVDKTTGEVVDYATVAVGKRDTVRFSMTRLQKAEAGRVVGQRLAQIAAAVRPELGP